MAGVAAKWRDGLNISAARKTKEYGPMSGESTVDLQAVADESFCYVVTSGRRSGKPHEIEIWFALRGATIYLLSGGGLRADWVKNLTATPEVEVRIGPHEFACSARLVDDADEEAWARTALLEKYQGGYGGDLTGWSQKALPVAIDLVDS